MIDLRHDWGYIEDIAKQRLENNITEHHVGHDGIEVLGAAGELAARYLLCQEPKLHTRFDGGCDILINGTRIDVKTTKWTPRLRYRYLQWPLGRQIKADVILLMAVNTKKQCATAVGYAYGSWILLATINHTRYQPCYEIPVTKLLPIRRLIHEIFPQAKTPAH